jgi:hypothetical protein
MGRLREGKIRPGGQATKALKFLNDHSAQTNPAKCAGLGDKCCSQAAKIRQRGTNTLRDRVSRDPGKEQPEVRPSKLKSSLIIINQIESIACDGAAC